jgi:minor histocompatibility antigen H13
MRTGQLRRLQNAPNAFEKHILLTKMTDLPARAVCRASAVAFTCKAVRQRRLLQRAGMISSGRKHISRNHAVDQQSESGAGVEDSAVPPSSPTGSQMTVWRWEESDDALRTYAAFLLVLGVGSLPALHSWHLADLPYFISLALITIYCGAHRGLNAKQRQQINLREGFLAPFAASVAILGVWAVIKFFPDLSLQTAFDAYFWLLAVVASIGAFAAPARKLGSPLGLPKWQMQLPKWLLQVAEAEKKVEHLELQLTDLVVLAVSVGLASADLAAHHTNFTLNNAIACLVAADILQLVGLSSFRAAGVLLVGLLLYDVYFVFGSAKTLGENVMLTVATSDILVGPTRLLFPRIPGSVGEASSFPFSLLGLGDVAVPGLLACLSLRFDASRSVDIRGRAVAAAEAMQEALEALHPDATGDEIADAAGGAAEAAYDKIADLEVEQRARTQGESLIGKETVYNTTDSVMTGRTYFKWTMTAYIIGLSLAFAANAITGLGQPALLYLVPCTLGTVATVAASRKEISRLWAFKDTLPTALKMTSNR